MKNITRLIFKGDIRMKLRQTLAAAALTLACAAPAVADDNNPTAADICMTTVLNSLVKTVRPSNLTVDTDLLKLYVAECEKSTGTQVGKLYQGMTEFKIGLK
jgi:hypothetical protein